MRRAAVNLDSGDQLDCHGDSAGLGEQQADEYQNLHGSRLRRGTAGDEYADESAR